MRTRHHLIALAALFAASAVAQPDVSRDDVLAALRKAVAFFRVEVSTQGGYVWVCSGDLKLKEGEAITDESMIWVQPPGTPTVGEAFLDAYDATGDPFFLSPAYDAGMTLLATQMHSGGWGYGAELDPEKRRAYNYRDLPDHKTERWKSETQMDDDVTQSAIRFLSRLDAALGFRNARLHEAVLYALDSLVGAQFPNGAWYAWWREFPRKPHDLDKYPVIPASYPDTWLREWPNTWQGCYVLNDDLVSDAIDTLLRAHEIYADPRYLAAARKAGDFLLLARMPDPQPAWAQQYNDKMQPEWSRKFEPPAISSAESEVVMEVLMRLYERTGDDKYLEPIPAALSYLRSSLLPDGRIARFYELRTNRPLYFDRSYKLTYDASAMPKHYGFILPSRLGEIEAAYRRVLAGETAPPAAVPAATEIAKLISSMDPRGAWLDEGVMDGHEVRPDSGLIRSTTFCANIATLCAYLRSAD